jgi:hypothetical protein
MTVLQNQDLLLPLAKYLMVSFQLTVFFWPFFKGQLVLKTIESRFEALHYFTSGSSGA